MQDGIRVLLVGAAGRMGQAISRAAETRSDIDLVARCGRGDSIEQSIEICDVVVDVSTADAAEEICAACVAHSKPLVTGTTGHSREQKGAIQRAAKAIPIVLAPNFSVGVNTLFWLTRRAAELIGDDFDVEIVEAHHRLKKDAPSGTAKRLAELVCDARALHYDKNVVHGRHGRVVDRPFDQVGIHAIRGGDGVGEHTVIFAGAGERLELTHRASSRNTFAIGALRAARWITGRSPLLYTMEDVLELNSVR